LFALSLLPAAAVTLHGQVKNEEHVCDAVQGTPERISGADGQGRGWLTTSFAHLMIYQDPKMLQQ
jgi:hypothetical protein